MTNLLTSQAKQALLERRRHTHGEAGAAWVEGLPERIRTVADAWSLRLEPNFDNLSYNYVAPCRLADGTRAVLKLVFPDNAESLTEMEALRHFSGRGCVRLIDADPQLGAALMQRADPGLPVSSLNDDPAEVHATVSVMRALWRPTPGEASFPTMADWIERVAKRAKTRALRYDWLDAGIILGRRLITQPGAPAVLLHSDLHHDNVLSSENGWLGIDPKGVIGEPAWDIGPYLYNNLADSEPETSWRRTVRRRAEQFADELGFDRQRVNACAAVYAVISGSWLLEVGYGVDRIVKRRAVMQELAGL